MPARACLAAATVPLFVGAPRGTPRYPDGFDGVACFTDGGRRVFRDDGCAGMDRRRLIWDARESCWGELHRRGSRPQAFSLREDFQRSR
jgi:hypothetical protein